MSSTSDPTSTPTSTSTSTSTSNSLLITLAAHSIHVMSTLASNMNLSYICQCILSPTILTPPVDDPYGHEYAKILEKELQLQLDHAWCDKSKKIDVQVRPNEHGRLKGEPPGFELMVQGQAGEHTGSLWNAMIQSFVFHHPSILRIINRIGYLHPTIPSALDEEKFNLVEYKDTDEIIHAKVHVLALLMKKYKNQTVTYTGAGISTACKIPDYRGPSGVWTARDHHTPASHTGPIEFENCIPSYTHWCIRYMLENEWIKYVTSQNVDGLHRRSGIPPNQISELHGNCFRELCTSCGADHIRTFNVRRNQGDFFKDVQDYTKTRHITGRKCDTCHTGMLRDSIIHFGENLPSDALKRANHEAKQSMISLCLGTSLRVHPAADIPTHTRGPIILVNLQHTGIETETLESTGFHIYARTDGVMKQLLSELEIDEKQVIPHDVYQQVMHMMETAGQPVQTATTTTTTTTTTTQSNSSNPYTIFG